MIQFLLVCCIILSTAIAGSLRPSAPVKPGAAELNKINPKNIPSHILDSIPIGDHLHVSVYGFIADYLRQSKDWSEIEIKKLIANETEVLKDPINLKPYVVTTCEGEIPGLLSKLCIADKHCLSLTLYQRNGVEVASGFDQQKLDFFSSKDWVDEDLSEQCGVLGLTPLDKIGYKKQFVSNGKFIDKVVAIIAEDSRHIPYVDTKLQQPTDKILGYIKYKQHPISSS